MGLDMYLTGEKYLSQYRDEEKKQSEAVKALIAAPFEVEGVKIRLAYWRKSNQIHKWFVDNVQNGVDECQESYVDREQLETLLKLVNEVLADHSKAETLLPNQSGFFFGSTDYDEWYFKNLESTKEQLEKILAADLDDYSIHYRASW